MKLFSLLSGIVISLWCCSCLTFGEKYENIPPGIWRGTLTLNTDSTDFDEQTGGVLPFNFEVIYDAPDSFHIEIINGDERIIVRDIKMGVDRRTARDTIWINFPVYDSHIEAQYEEDAIEGWWVQRNRKEYKIQFKALHGQDYRFVQMPKPASADLTGRWECHFGIESEQQSTSIADFTQQGNKITGTFLSPTGDDRFLEGTVSDDRLFLSVFDGSHAYLYEAKIQADGSLTGIYRSGKHYKTYWDAKRNDTIQLSDLGDPMTLTSMRSGEPFSLRFDTPEGESIDLQHLTYKGKPKIIQILGTWCPNCRDETDFLLSYLEKNPDPGFEILGISFERHEDTTRAMTAIQTYKDKMNIPYTLVYGGSNNKEAASKALPMLSKVIAFPTLIFLDASDHVVAIHTGFAGPATKEYKTFAAEFDHMVEKMKGTHE